MAISIKEIQTSSKDQLAHSKGSEKESALSQILNMQLGSQKLKDAFKEHFYAELALLLDSGLNLKSSLELIKEQEKKQTHKQLIERLLNELTAGAKFSDILKSQSSFTAYEYFSVQIGEETGNLSQIFKGLAEYFGQRISQKRNFISALTYPMVILFTAILAISFMFLFMVPMFKEVFARMGNELPWLTKVIINLSENFSTMLMAALILITALFLMHRQFRKRDAYRLKFGLLIRKVPLIGPMILKNHTLRMLQSLALLMKSKVPLVEALELCSRMLSYYPLQKALDDSRALVMSGSGFYDGIKRNPLFSAKLKGLVKVGEETNQLGFLLEKMSQQTEKEIEHQSKVLGNIMEPLIIVFLGAFVALILIAMYLPMFQLSATY